MPTEPADNLALLARAFALHQAGRHDAAETAYAAVLATSPDDVTALVNGGALAQARGDGSVAVARLERAVRLAPRNPVALTNLGLALIHAGRDADALAALDRSLGIAANSAQTHNHRGVALARLGRNVDAIAAFERALALDPRHVEAAQNLGERCNDAGDGARARAAFGLVLAQLPAYRPARIGQAFALALDGHLDLAIRDLETIVAQAPDDAQAWQTLGALRNWAWLHATAEEAFERALALEPANADSAFGVASTLLARQRYAEGWSAFERRADRGTALAALPPWDGARFDGTLVLHGEQGYGDVIQFARFVPAARALCRRVVLLMEGYHRPLAPLLRTLAGVDQVATRVGELPDTGVTRRLSLLSLPQRLSVGVTDLGAGRYVSPPDECAARWRARVDAVPGPRVGLAWSVAARDVHAFVARHKSVPPAVLAPLLETPGTAFFALQPGAAGLPAAFAGRASPLHDLTGDIADFADTAALIDAMDLVIAPDTAVAHLAGALGKPVWLLDRFNCCWRWRASPDSSPWYPSMRIFRQARLGDWATIEPALAAAFSAWRRGL